jgi:hypothetical protein
MYCNVSACLQVSSISPATEWSSNRLSHHRWATIPVVKVAQKEKFIDLPPELELPWSFLRRHYGITSQGGNVTSNYFYNFDARENIVYQINCCNTETIRSAEYHFAHMFPVMEKLVCTDHGRITSSISDCLN